jgi:OPA family sugar phosphate sensor protein UhpC-like MFS transporter
LELVSLVFIFILPTRNYAILTAAFGLFGFAIGGLLLGLCGLLAVDIAPKKAAGAVLGVVGIFSYIAAAIQESVSGRLIQQHIRMIDGVRHYDFQAVVVFWVGSAVLAMVLGLTLWKAKVEE